ncbi:UDP-N-acetylglucosamine-peptide N-acetylglucosaminyltransferase [Xanthomonas oryzae]|uniref:protein O-GlcNAc transferase n=1 Tax=Xanthomonas oryzae TaxID=347 RepID=A0AAP0ZI76_9XANT|nr:tetratricopeptide repeat protein [Xanthomonas oryzae]KOR39440.1 UDP-N-acetylglucosamine-peptide N-acetylglucosaminyltransferase [Xanthomonas oryzae]QBG82692.1 tetratricopeptide repeat protein [Xanthomonas oryzae]
MSAQVPRALLQLREAVRRQPGDLVTWLMLADAELGMGATAAGEAAVQRALALHPGHPEAIARLGRVRWAQQRHAEAATLLQQASDLVTQHPGIALWLGHALEDAGQPEQAAAAYTRAHQLLPDEPYITAQLLNWRRRLCDWRELESLAAQVRTAVARGEAAVEPFAFLSEDASAAEQLACARTRAQAIATSLRPLPAAAVRSRGALQLGFVSNGFGAHPTGLLTVAVFEALQRRQPDMQVHLFATSHDDGSEIRARPAQGTRVHDVTALGHLATAQHIRDQGIDLLFDLRGWGGGGRPEVFALRPAPIQINWLAYPGTSGAPWMDYVLGDAVALPPSLEPFYSEQMLRLPRVFQPSDTSRIVAEPPSRAECGLPEQGAVLCCFNNSYKLNPRSMARMLAVLRAVPGCVLWLLSGPGKADARLRAFAQTQGVDPQRLVFMPKLPHPRYLARYRHADLFLDTHPYNAHTTASDALWAGCPVLTTPGETFAARVAGSLNQHLGLDEMNVVDDAAFVAKAIEVASDSNAMRGVRARLAEQRLRSGVFDMDGFADDLAALLRDVARRSGWLGV